MKWIRLFYTWVLLHGFDYFMSYYLHNYINGLYEGNILLRYIFEQNIIIVITTFIIIQIAIYYIAKALEIIENTIHKHFKIKFRKIMTLTFFTFLCTIQTFTIIHNIMLALGRC